MASATRKGVFVVTVRLPGNIAAGSYAPSVDCSNGISGTGTLTVHAGAVIPVGVPVTGDGVTSTATGGPLTAAGIGVLGLSALFGALAARRRRKSARG
jgi:MYXO-CTERM domain-containing protein